MDLARSVILNVLGFNRQAKNVIDETLAGGAEIEALNPTLHIGADVADLARIKTEIASMLSAIEAMRADATVGLNDEGVLERADALAAGLQALNRIVVDPDITSEQLVNALATVEEYKDALHSISGIDATATADLDTSPAVVKLAGLDAMLAAFSAEQIKGPGLDDLLGGLAAASVEATTLNQLLSNDMAVKAPGLDELLTGLAEAKVEATALDDLLIKDQQAKITANIDLAPFYAQIDAVIERMETLRWQLTRPIGLAISVREATAALAAIKAEIDALKVKELAIPIAVVPINIGALHEEFSQLDAQAQLVFQAVAQGATAAGAATGNLGAGAAKATGQFMVFGIVSLKSLHWIISGSAELLAVLAPAATVIAAAAFVWTQGAQAIFQHMKDLFTATESLGQAAHATMGEELGLNGAWQKFQNMANIDVFQAMGAGLNILKERFSNLALAGYQLGQVFDTFTAKLVYDMSDAGGAGKEMNELLSHMGSDATDLGEVFGSLGHAIVGLAAQMPGLAELLLKVLALFVTGASDVINFADRFKIAGWSLVTLLIAGEEFTRWGGDVLIPILAKMGIETEDLGEKFLSTQRWAGVFMTFFKLLPNLVGGAAVIIGGLITKLPLLGGAGTAAGEGLMKFGLYLRSAVAEMPVWQAALIVVAAVGLAILIDKMVTAQTAAQKFASSLTQAADAASDLNVMGVLGSNIDKLQQSEQQASVKTKDLTSQLGAVNVASNSAAVAAYGYRSGIASQVTGLTAAKAAIGTYQGALVQNAQVLGTVNDNAVYLASTYHTTVPEAMALAQAAGVKLTTSLRGNSEAASIARDQIRNMVTGIDAMGVPLGEVGNEMLALNIQTGMQGSQMQKATQAMQAYMQMVVGGTDDLGQFTQGMENLTNITNTTKFSLSQSTAGMSLSVTQFAKALQGSGAKSAQAWQNFDQVVGTTAPNLLGWFQTAQSVGAITFPKMTQGIKDMIAEMLPFAKGSATATSELSALAQQVGGPATSNWQQLASWVGKTGGAAKNLTGIVNGTTIAMGNMNTIAQNLGNTMNTDLTQMFDQARIASSHVNSAINTYTTDLLNNSQATAQGQSDRQTLFNDLIKIGLTAQQANLWIKTVTDSVHHNSSATQSGHESRQQMVNDMQNQADKASHLHGNISKLNDVLSHISRNWPITLTEHATGTWSVGQGGIYPTPTGAPPTRLGERAEGWRVPGYGGGDQIPVVVEPGETIVPKHLTHLVAPLMKRHGVPGFAKGGWIPEKTWEKEHPWKSDWVPDKIWDKEHPWKSDWIPAKQWDKEHPWKSNWVPAAKWDKEHPFKSSFTSSSGSSTSSHPAFLTKAWDKANPWHGFAAGGLIVDSNYSGGMSGTPGWTASTFQQSLSATEHSLESRAQAAISSAALGGLYTGKFGSGVAQWSNDVMAALRMLHLSPGLAFQVLYQMQTESSGNPNAINLSDSNAAAGDPSRGLMQVIGTTFEEYAGPYARLGIYNPMANIYAALNYARNRYGPTLMRGGVGIGSGHGYSSGGIIPEPVFGIGAHSGSRYSFAEHAPEMVTPMNRVGRAAGSDTFNIHFNGIVTDPDATAMKVQQLLRNLKKHRGNQPLGLD